MGKPELAQSTEGQVVEMRFFQSTAGLTHAYQRTTLQRAQCQKLISLKNKNV